MAKKILLVLLIVMLFLTGVTLAVINFFPQFVLTPKYMYLMAENQAKNKVEKQIKSFLKDDFVKDSLKIYETSFNSQTELTTKMGLNNLKGTGAEQFKDLLELFGSAKIVSEQSANYKKEQSRSKLSLALKGTKPLSIDIFQNKERFGVSFPGLYDKYIVFNKNNLEPVYEKFEEIKGPKKIVTNADIIKVIKFSEKDFKKVIKDYSKFYASYITDKDVTFTSGVKLPTAEGNINCAQLMLKLDQKRLNDFSIKLLEKISNDDRLLNLTVQNYINILKLYEEAGYFVDAADELKDLTAFKKSIKENIEEIKSSMAENKENKDFIMTLYVGRGLNVLERRIQVVDKNNLVDSKPRILGDIKIGDYKLPKSKAKSSILEILEGDAIEEGIIMRGLKFNYTRKPAVQGKPKEGNITYDIVQIEDGEESELLTSVFKLVLNEVKGKQRDIKSDFEIVSYDSLDLTKSSRTTGKITALMERNTEKRTLDSKLSIDAISKEEGVNVKNSRESEYSINVNKKVKFKVPVEMPKLTSANAVDFNNSSKRDIQRAVQEIQAALIELIFKNAALLQKTQ